MHKQNSLASVWTDPGNPQASDDIFYIEIYFFSIIILMYIIYLFSYHQNSIPIFIIIPFIKFFVFWYQQFYKKLI